MSKSGHTLKCNSVPDKIRTEIEFSHQKYLGTQPLYENAYHSIQKCINILSVALKWLSVYEGWCSLEMHISVWRPLCLEMGNDVCKLVCLEMLTNVCKPLCLEIGINECKPLCANHCAWNGYQSMKTTVSWKLYQCMQAIVLCLEIHISVTLHL